MGGLLLEVGGWRLIFFVNVPAGILGTIAAWVLLPRSRDLQARTPYDWGGLALFVPTVLCTLVAISFGGHWGWVSLPVIGLVVTATCAGALFITREGRVAAPMLDLSLFRRAPFSIGAAGGLLSFVVLFGTMFAVPFFLERGRGQGSGHAGLVLTVVPLALGCVAPVAGKLAERTGDARSRCRGWRCARRCSPSSVQANRRDGSLRASSASSGQGWDCSSRRTTPSS